MSISRSGSQIPQPSRSSTHALVVAYLALFVCLGGSSLADRGGRLTSERSPAAKAAVGAQLAESRRGPRGPRGRRGPRGPRGRPGATDVIIRSAVVPPHPAGVTSGPTGALLECQGDEVATGGGFSDDVSVTEARGAAVLSSQPTGPQGKPTAWVVQFADYVPGRKVYVVCARP